MPDRIWIGSRAGKSFSGVKSWLKRPDEPTELAAAAAAVVCLFSTWR